MADWPEPQKLRDLLTHFVEREHALLTTKSKQTVGFYPSITPSVLHKLEWMLKNTKD